MSDILDITKSEYIDTLKNKRKHVSSKIDDDALLKRVKYLKKRDLIHLATIRGLVFDESSLESILDALFKDIHKKNQTKLIDDLHKHYHKKNQTKLIDDLHKYHHRKKQSELMVDLHRYHHKQKSKNIKKRYTETFKKERPIKLLTN